MPDTTPADLSAKRQRAFLLNKFGTAKAGELAPKQANSVPAWAKKQLDLTPDVTTRLVEQLMADRLLVLTTVKGKDKIAITPAGRELLATLGELIPSEPPKAEKKPRVPRKSLAEQTAEKVRTKVAELGEAAVPASKLGKPGGKNPKPEAVAAFEQTVRELIAEGKLFEHPGGKYGTLPAPTLAEIVRREVQAKLDTAEGPFKPADLSKPKPKATADEKQAHADALAAAIAELTTAKKLFPHPGDKYGQLPYTEPDYTDRELREVYTLDIFSRAPDHTITKADIELAFPGKGKPDLKTLKAKYAHVARFRGQGCFEMGAPATRQTLEQLVASGDLRADEKGEAYTLTDAGVARLTRSRAAYPLLPPVGIPAVADDDAMRELWEAFVLLKLAEATNFTLGESAVFVGGYPKGSKLNEATAWVLYGELAKAGHLTARWNESEGEYTLTPTGLRYLAGRSFDEFDKLEIKGKALTALLTAARGGPPATATPSPTSPTTADLEAAVMDIFRQVHTERFNNKQMVPIHEVRAEVRRQLGDEAASHAVFDKTLNALFRADRVRLIPIDDRSRAAEQELHDSINSAVGILFYMENVDGSPSV